MPRAAMKRSRALTPRLAFGVCLLGWTMVNAQSQPAPSVGAPLQPGAAAEIAAKGAIRGRVFGANGRPLTRAQVPG